MAHGDPNNPKKNPHPVKRYEVVAMADAPGSWDSVKGIVFFDVVNTNCVPRGTFTGGQNVPNIGLDFEMTRVGEKTWKGYFYRDALQDEDYFGLGVCHWEATQASPVFTVHGSNFTPDSGLENSKPYTDYFKRSAFADQTLRDAALDFSPSNPEYTRNPDAFFSITVTVKEVTP